MILKSYIVEQNINILENYKGILIYGQNSGIKDDIKQILKNKNQSSEIIIFFEDEILKEWGSSHPIGRMASIHDIGELVGFLCSDKASFITGSSYVIDGGLMTQVPVILPD